MSSANARPTGLLDVCHSKTLKKYEKGLDSVFRFLKKELCSNQKRKSYDGAKRVRFVRLLYFAAFVCRQQTRDLQVCWIFAKRKRPTKHAKGLDFVFRLLKKNLVRTKNANASRAKNGTIRAKTHPQAK
jgi:hypothetical protein